MVVDLSTVAEILEDCAVLTTELNGQTIPNGSDVARLNRNLLNLADQLGLAAALVRNEYWQGREGISYSMGSAL